MAASVHTILVVDGDQRFRHLIRTVLDRAGFEPVVAGDTDSAITLAAERPPDLALLDVVLPGASGFEFYQELRDRFGQELPIIFVSGERTDAHDRVAGLLLGADDYLVKPVDPDELIARVRRSLRLRAQPYKLGSERELPIPLTAREEEVFTLLFEGKDSGEIARELTISVRTVDTHVRHILHKLGVHSRARAVALERRAGRDRRDVLA